MGGVAVALLDVVVESFIVLLLFLLASKKQHRLQINPILHNGFPYLINTRIKFDLWLVMLTWKVFYSYKYMHHFKQF